MNLLNNKRPCQNVGGILKIWLQNSCDVSEDISQELTFVTEPSFTVPSEFAEYQFTRTSARITEEEINNKNGRLVIYKVRFTLAKATIENEREINKLRNSDKIIVVVQDNNKNYRVFGSKCNPAELKITYNSGSELGNENIYSVEITSAEVQKPYRLPIPTDPPYIPPPKSVIPIYLNIASRTLVFKANWDYLGQKIYRMYGGLTTDSFVFKVNPNPLAVDESHPSWAALPYLNHDDFIASTINQNYQIWIECVFIDLLVTEVLIETGKASINLSNTVLIQQHYQTVASDIMLALPNIGSSSSNFSSAIAANIKYGRRENANFITGEDFTDFSNNLVDVNAALNFGDVAHVHFENTVPLTVPTHFKTININFGSGNYEVAQIETPLKKRYYPFSSNPTSLNGNSTNNRFIVPDSTTGARLFTISGMQVGEERSYTWLATPAYFGVYPNGNSGDILGNRDNLSFAGITYTEFGGGGFVQHRFTPVLQHRAQYVTIKIRRKALIGTAANVFDVEMYVNARPLTSSLVFGTISRSDDPFAALGYHFGNRYSDNIASSNIRLWQCNRRWIQNSELKSLHLANESIDAEYKYLFNSIVNSNEIPAIGTSQHDNIKIINSAALTNLL